MEDLSESDSGYVVGAITLALVKNITCFNLEPHDFVLVKCNFLSLQTPPFDLTHREIDNPSWERPDFFFFCCIVLHYFSNFLYLSGRINLIAMGKIESLWRGQALTPFGWYPPSASWEEKYPAPRVGLFVNWFGRSTMGQGSIIEIGS